LRTVVAIPPISELCRRVSIQTYSVIERCSTSIRAGLKGLTRVVTNARRRGAPGEFVL